MSGVIKPTRVRERSSYTESVYSTPLVDVYAVNKIVGGKYTPALEVHIVVSEHGLSEEQVQRLVAADGG